MHQINRRWHEEKARTSKKRNKQLILARESKRRKVNGHNQQAENKEPVDSKDSDQFLLVHSSTWNNLLINIKCSECGEQKLKVKICDSLGLASKIILKCSNCEWVAGQTYSSPRAESKPRSPFVVNKRIVDSVNSIGLGFSALERMCSIFSMQCLTKTAFHLQLQTLYREASELKKNILESSQKEIKEAYQKLNCNQSNVEQLIDISISYDGTWQRRGHRSLYGIGIAIDIVTGLAIDFEVLSKFCLSCTIAAASFNCDSSEYKVWKENHIASKECDINFNGSSNAMEAAAAAIIWKRSIDLHKFRYTTMLSDGDSKTWLHLQELAPYGTSVIITKEECVNHVSKRLGKALREVSKKERLGGRSEGALTEKKILCLNSYYRKAIVSNLNDISEMKKEILAALYHCSSTDLEPKHHNCPIGKNSWCFFNKALALGNVPHSHETMSVKISARVAEKIKPVYDRLSDDELLLRCAKGKTQNANECLHALIWRKCPKEVFVSKKRIEMAVINAISEFNNGIAKSLQMKAVLRGDQLDSVTLAYAKERDTLRQKRRTEEEKFKRKLRRNSKKQVSACSNNKTKNKWYGAGYF